MKKLLLLLVMMGAFISVNAQMCKSTGGVESTNISKGEACDEIVVTLHNTNSYKVTVDLSVTVVDNDGNEALRQKTVYRFNKQSYKKVAQGV